MRGIHEKEKLNVGLNTDKLNCNLVKNESHFPSAPVAMRKPEYITKFNHTRVDYYSWLKEKNNPQVIKYLEDENAYADMVTAGSKELEEVIYNEIKGRITEDDYSAPTFNNGYYYYSRTEKGKQYKIYCRKKEVLSAREEVLFDVNALASGKDAFIFADFEVSPDNRFAAYLINETGSYAEYTLKVKDLSTDADLHGINIPNVQDVVWANDNCTLFYTLINNALRPCKVLRQDIFGNKPGEVVFEEPDELFIVNLQKSKTGEFLFISSSSFTTSEYYLLNANTPFEGFRSFLPRVKDVDYGVYHHKNNFFVQYKDKVHYNGMLFEAPLDSYYLKETWKLVMDHDEDTMIDYLDIFNNFYAIQIRRNGLTEIIVKGICKPVDRRINFPEPVYLAEIMPSPDYFSKKLRYYYTSLNRPNTVYDYEPFEGISEIVKKTEIPSGFNPDDYTVERLYATSHDGIKVPLSIVYKNNLVKNGSNPLLMYSYGAYGVSTDAAFISSFYSLIDRGFIFAMAQVRGGSDLGEQWYENGKLLNKKNTFFDFIACAEHLINDNYTSPDKLCIMGGSAGGLLVTAVANMRPNLFHTVVANVPFVDVVNTMMDPSLPLTVQEYEEWGDPNKKENYDYLLSYSPYDNIAPVEYPNMLITAGLNDSQVGFHEPAKYTAKLRNLKSGSNLLLLKTNMQSGHGGATGRFDQIREISFELAFILTTFAINS